MVNVDGDCDSKGLGVGIAIFTPMGGLIEKCIWFSFLATNNIDEYEVIFLEIHQLYSLESQKVLIYSNSHLIINQVNNAFEAKNERMKKYLEETFDVGL